VIRFGIFRGIDDCLIVGDSMNDFGEILIYQTEDGHTRLDVRLHDETLWLTQLQIAELFQKDKNTISEHINNIYDERELAPEATVRKFRSVQIEGKREVARELAYYSLEMILAVGYRVKSHRGTQFRQWTTINLKEYLIKGFVLNDIRLKNPGGLDYFDDLLERIRDIRSSEKRFYQKVRDIYATSMDYDPHSEYAQIFFKTVQNKMLWAVTRKTAAELIAERANPNLPNMGLKSWQNQRIRKTDIIISKNYLVHEELTELNRIVTMFLDYAEDQARSRKTMTMQDWAERVDKFLVFNDRELLTHAGNISHEQAEQLVNERYDLFKLQQREAERLTAETEYVEELAALEKEIIKKK
jgi:hypothetical protein